MSGVVSGVACPWDDVAGEPGVVAGAGDWAAGAWAVPEAAGGGFTVCSPGSNAFAGCVADLGAGGGTRGTAGLRLGNGATEGGLTFAGTAATTGAALFTSDATGAGGGVSAAFGITTATGGALAGDGVVAATGGTAVATGGAVAGVGMVTETGGADAGSGGEEAGAGGVTA